MINENFGWGYHVNTVPPYGIIDYPSGEVLGALTTIYTMPATAYGFITFADISVVTGSERKAWSAVYTSGAALKLYIRRWHLLAGTQVVDGHTFIPPIPISPSETIRIYTEHVTCRQNALFHVYRINF